MAGCPPSPQPPAPQPAEIKAELRPYQLRGLQFLRDTFANGVNAILADEMGLGKTLQSIALLAHVKFERKLAGPHLVVVPLSVMSSWLNELRKWCPALRVKKVHTSDGKESDRIKAELRDLDTYDVCVTTYEMVRSGSFEFFFSRDVIWRCLILDEGHKIKNEHALVSLAVKKIKAQYSLILTGTPLQNNLHELFAVLQFLHPTIFIDSGT